MVVRMVLRMVLRKGRIMGLSRRRRKGSPEIKAHRNLRGMQMNYVLESELTPKRTPTLSYREVEEFWDVCIDDDVFDEDLHEDEEGDDPLEA